MVQAKAETTAYREPPAMRFWKVLWGVLFGVGLVGVGQRLLFGHRLAAYGSYVPWGLWVSAYLYFIGLSAGAFLLSSLAYVFGVRKLERVGRIALITALITLLMALLSIWFDLGHMERFYFVHTRPNFRSMMAWMVWLYTAYFLLLAVELWSVLKRPDDVRLIRVLGTLGVPLAIAFHGGVGALFATVVAHPYWHNPITPILFLTGALVSGGGLLTAVIAFLYPMPEDERRELTALMGRIVGGLLLFDLLLEWAEFSVPLWYGGFGEEVTNLKLVLFGRFWWVFWIVHLLIGSLVPLALIFGNRKPSAVGLGGLLIAISFLSVRLNVVIPALVTPHIEGLQEAFIDPRLQFDYVPSLHEWLVLLFIVALGVGLFYGSFKVLVQFESRRATQGEGGPA